MALSRDDYISNSIEAQRVSLAPTTYKTNIVTNSPIKHSIITKQNREALLRLMVDVAVMLGADKTTAESQMTVVLEFEIKLAQVMKRFHF